jgi:hypothetical protein
MPKELKEKPKEEDSVGQLQGQLDELRIQIQNMENRPSLEESISLTFTDIPFDPTRKIDLAIFSKAVFNSEIDNGNSGTAKTINWNAGNKQKITLTGNATLTFTSPIGPCNLVFKVVQDATGSRTLTYPATVKWVGGSAPTLTTAANAVDILVFYYDGTNYYGDSALNFS